MRARGGALSGLFGSPERVPRPRVPVRDHPALTVLWCGRPRDGSPRFPVDRDSAGPRRVGMRPSFAGLGGGGEETQAPGRARLGPPTSELRTPSSARICTSEAPAGLEGLAAAGSPWADLARRCRAADANPRLPHGNRASARGGIGERHFHGATSSITQARRGLSLFVLS